MTAKTSSSRPGSSNAWWVAEARPFTSSTQAATATKPSSRAVTTTGWNNRAKGAVTRRVTAGSLTT